MRGLLRLADGRRSEARADLEEVLTLAPGHLRAAMMVGRLAVERRDFKAGGAGARGARGESRGER